jgi:hypothetical protein
MEFDNGMKAAYVLGCAKCRNLPRHCLGPVKVKEPIPIRKQLSLEEKS